MHYLCLRLVSKALLGSLFKLAISGLICRPILSSVFMLPHVGLYSWHMYTWGPILTCIRSVPAFGLGLALSQYFPTCHLWMIGFESLVQKIYTFSFMIIVITLNINMPIQEVLPGPLKLDPVISVSLSCTLVILPNYKI